LQGNCPICHESMFESTVPLRGMKCGHVMHLHCYNEYACRCYHGKITCPLCKQVFDNLRGWKVFTCLIDSFVLLVYAYLFVFNIYLASSFLHVEMF
jgi:zinc finger-like protein